MLLIAFIITTLQAAAYVASLSLPVNPGGLNLGKDYQQYKACKAADPATTVCFTSAYIDMASGAYFIS